MDGLTRVAVGGSDIAVGWRGSGVGGAALYKGYDGLYVEILTSNAASQICFRSTSELYKGYGCDGKIKSIDIFLFPDAPCEDIVQTSRPRRVELDSSVHPFIYQ